ncbi:MAG: T9SS type A sorting domain-containing protein, partial [Bacteroidota bacterium]
PNPFNKYINLSIQSSIEQHIEVKLFDLVGKLVHQQQLLVGTGANNIAMDFSKQHLSTGIYHLIAMEENGNIKTIKVLHVED